MCGIVGIVGLSDERARQSALKALAHRGPDGHGEYSAPGDHVWLGHARLAIIDPEGGKQPLSNEDETIWVSFNGCIYNYVELAQMLRSRGHRLRSYTDTEVIVHAYEEFGTDCLKYFTGMFAFAVWDETKHELFCARDRIGIKPFYYWQGADTFVFGSEIKSLLATGMVSKRVDPQAIEEYIVMQTVLGERTLFQQVKKLLPGHFMIVDHRGSIREYRQYWDLDFTMDYDHTEEYFTERLRVLLDDAVKIRLRSDVPLGAHLSGGLDSSTVVSLAALNNPAGTGPVTFTGAFPEGDKFDETAYAKLVAESCSCTSKIIYPTARDFMESLPRIVYYMDEPAAGPGVFPQYMVSQLASRYVKVVLGGQGGDEIFAGYARYLVGYLEECLKGAIEETEDTASYAATLSSIIPSLPMLKQYTPMLRYFWADGLFDSQSKRYFRLMDRSAGVRDIYQPDVFSPGGKVFDTFEQIFNASNAKSFLNRMLYFDLKVHLPALLHVEDRTSMAWGLESRVPLLDHRIAELVASIPPTIKFKGGTPKYLFRNAVKNLLPPAILQRKDKMGFPVPLHLWFKGPLRDFVSDVLLSQRAKQRGIFAAQQLEKAITREADFGRVIWGALCLEMWFKTFIDQ